LERKAEEKAMLETETKKVETESVRPTALKELKHMYTTRAAKAMRLDNAYNKAWRTRIDAQISRSATPSSTEDEKNAAIASENAAVGRTQAALDIGRKEAEDAKDALLQAAEAQGKSVMVLNTMELKKSARTCQHAFVLTVGDVVRGTTVPAMIKAKIDALEIITAEVTAAEDAYS
jgi:hypothetical protein